MSRTMSGIPTSGGGDVKLDGNPNAFSGTNTFNVNRPTSTLTSTIAATDFITKQDGQSLFSVSGAALLAGDPNTFSGTNTFNARRPTTTLTDTPAANEFITKQNADVLYGGLQQTGYENEFAPNKSYVVSQGNPTLAGNAQGDNLGGRMENALNADIEIPTGHSGKVLVSFCVSGEWSGAPYNNGVILGRATKQANGSYIYDKLIRANPFGLAGLFISNFMISFQSDENSTIEHATGIIMDDTISAGNTYRYTPILVNSNGSSSNTTFKLNRTINSASNLGLERTCSSVVASLVNISS